MPYLLLSPSFYQNQSPNNCVLQCIGEAKRTFSLIGVEIRVKLYSPSGADIPTLFRAFRRLVLLNDGNITTYDLSTEAIFPMDTHGKEIWSMPAGFTDVIYRLNYRICSGNIIHPGTITTRIATGDESSWCGKRISILEVTLEVAPLPEKSHCSVQ